MWLELLACLNQLLTAVTEHTRNTGGKVCPRSLSACSHWAPLFSTVLRSKVPACHVVIASCFSLRCPLRESMRQNLGTGYGPRVQATSGLLTGSNSCKVPYIQVMWSLCKSIINEVIALRIQPFPQSPICVFAALRTKAMRIFDSEYKFKYHI